MRVFSLVVALLLWGCGGDASEREVLDVYAASSLTEAFGELEQVFEGTRPGVDVRITFAGSQVLRLQIEQGAPADVFASADPDHIEALVELGLVSRPRTFAGNELVLIVPVANPSGIQSFEQLPLAERIVLGTENVPAGRYAREVLRHASQQLGANFGSRVMDAVVSEETNVRLARAKVELGEADAALVYRTDAVASGGVTVFTIPETMNVAASYVIGLIPSGRAGRAGSDWVELVLSEEGRSVLARHGFTVE